jgi:hypothetical protein
VFKPLWEMNEKLLWDVTWEFGAEQSCAMKKTPCSHSILSMPH